MYIVLLGFLFIVVIYFDSKNESYKSCEVFLFYFLGIIMI